MAKLKRQIKPKKERVFKSDNKSKVKDKTGHKNGIDRRKKRKDAAIANERVEKEITEMKEDEFDVAPADDKNFIHHFIPKDDEVAEDDDKQEDTRKLVKDQNKKAKTKQQGGFQSFGLSYPVYKGVFKKGYKLPTPIQRKTIPLIMDGRDVVGMARTGSGKTAAFLVPMLEKLKVHSSGGIRAVVLSPTRELALQTAKFTHELGKFTDLKASLIVGGDSIENQFAALHENPDILIATPGRLLHLLVEMDMKQLSAVEYVVFDEGDQLFEMGFAEQLKEIVQRFPPSRQTVLFSATLPKILVDFATAGLNDPTLIRLDVDTKISDKLKTSYFLVRDEDKTAMLLHLLRSIIKSNELTVIFVSTRHHVDYLNELLNCSGLPCSFIYSSLDQTARKENLQKFRNKTTKILIVTDIAARGIDVPMLDNVINFDFPPRPKVFVHRVGRVARAGRSGNAYSFVLKEELAFFLDLHLFLGKSVSYSSNLTEADEDGVLGAVPQGVIVSELDYIKNKSENNYNLVTALKVMKNGYKGYVRTREAASVESNRRAKEIDISTIKTHPCLKNAVSETNEELSQLLLDLRKFKPSLTVFESITTKKNKEAENVMQLKRKQHNNVIEREQLRQKEKPMVIPQKKEIKSVSDDNYIASVFNVQKKDYKDENYIPRQATNDHQEKGLTLTSFEKDAHSVSVDLLGDENNTLNQGKANKKWDRKRKKFVGVENPNAKKFKTESGNYIPKSYKSDRYNDWKKNKNFNQNNGNEDDDNHTKGSHTFGQMNRFKKRMGNKVTGGKNVKRTLKSKDQIVKKRMKDDMMDKIRRKSKKPSANTKMSGRNGKQSNGRQSDGRNMKRKKK